MYSLFRKELKQFFGSIIGFLAIVVFLLMSGLFLWVFPGNFNIPDNGYATLESFFALAPWLYLFLVPAITMRLFAEEKRSGTIELLLTRPITDFSLVFSKFIAAFILVIFTLLPTLIYFWSVWQLGNPVGNIDTGSTWGAYFGLFFLAAIYVSIGLFSSAVTDNQIVSFILAVALSFLFFVGFEFIAGSGVPYILEILFNWLSINEHFLSVSRGVIDFGDLVYFLGMTFIFLFLSVMVIRRKRISIKKAGKWTAEILLGIAVLFVVSDNIRFRLDLTADKRYSLTNITKQIVSQVKEPISVEIFLDGELQPGFRKLQQAIIEKVHDMGRYTGRPVRVYLTDPYDAVPAGERNDFFDELMMKGVTPVDVRQQTEQGVLTRLIFPGAVIRMGNRETGINFLKNNQEYTAETNLNNSVESIEYELVFAIKKLMAEKKPSLVFLQGHNELNQWEVYDLCAYVSDVFEIDFMNADELLHSQTPDIIVVADPKEVFTEKDKYVIDQSVMRGSRLMWLIDPVQVSLDSLSNGMMTLAFPRDLNLNDQLFHYGVRLNADLVQDVVCMRIPVSSEVAGNKNYSLQPWYYSPLLTPSEKHPMSRYLDRIKSEFVSSIDTVGSSEIKKSVILSSSEHARIVRTPASVSLGMIDRPPARELFNLPHIATGVLLEGTFHSVFHGRLLNNIEVDVSQIIDKVAFNKMLVFSDGSLIANQVRYQSENQPAILPLGYDAYSKQTFRNKEFFVNALLYLADDEGIMQLRNRTIKLRLLDKVKLRENRKTWAWINTTVPVTAILIFAVAYNLIRRRKYRKN